MSYGIRLEVKGDYACFTRPELKVERVSYDCMTPSRPSSGIQASSGASTAFMSAVPSALRMCGGTKSG